MAAYASSDVHIVVPGRDVDDKDKAKEYLDYGLKNLKSTIDRWAMRRHMPRTTTESYTSTSESGSDVELAQATENNK